MCSCGGASPHHWNPTSHCGGGSDRDNKPVTFMSYNMTGADTVKCQWVREISSEHETSFIALQEHFKTIKSTEQWFKKQFSDYHGYVIPAHRRPGVDSGRGIGGLVQLSIKGQAVNRSRLVPQSPRVQAQLLTFPACRVLWINVYMPCDPQLEHFDDTELVETLSEIERLVTESSDCEVIVSGDINYEPRRNNHFTRTVSATLQRLRLSSVWEGHNIDFTHVHTDRVNTSVLDHFLLSQRLLSLVEDCGPVHRGDNLSRHSPIFLSLRLGDLQKKPQSKQPPPPRMPAWSRAREEELEAYTRTLHQKLTSVRCPGSLVHCRDPLCENSAHSKARDSVVLDILLAMVESSYNCLPLTGLAGGREAKDRKTVTPGWSAEVEPYKQRSNYCYRAWLAAGRPSQGDLHRSKVDSHTQFQYAVRRVKRASKLNQAKGLYEAAKAGDIALMSEMRKVQSGKGGLDEVPDTVDGVTGQEEVANQFGKVHSALYNSAESTEEMNELKNRIRGLVQTEDSKAEIGKLTVRDCQESRREDEAA